MAWLLSVMCGIPCQCLRRLSHRDKDERKKHSFTPTRTSALPYTQRWTLHNTLCQSGPCLWNVKWPASSYSHISSPIYTLQHTRTDTQPPRWHWAQASCLHITLLDPLSKNRHAQSEPLLPAECLTACHPPDSEQQLVTNITPWLV